MSRILIIDDDAGMRRVARGTLRTAGYEVAEAEDADGGLRRVRTHRPDLVVCDLHLGNQSGWDVLDAMRADRTVATIPFILITGEQAPTALRQSMEQGADDFLRKPFAAEELLAAVEARLRKQDAIQAEAQRALRNSEVRARAMAQAAFDAIILMGPDSLISFWNPAAERIFGYSEAEAMGRTLQSLLAPAPDQADGARALAQFECAGQGGAFGRTLELIALRKDGTAFPVELSLSGVSLDGLWHTVGIVRDVTRQKEANQLLRRERILLRTLVDALPDSIYAKDREGRKTLANQADVRAVGAACEADVLGKTDRELLDPATAQGCDADDRRVIARGEPVINRQELIINAHGGQRWMETTKLPLRDETGRIIGLVGIGHDFTERRRAEEQLRKLSLAVEQSPASVVITDTSGRIEYVNPKFCALTGYAPAEVIGQNPRVLKSGETPAEAYQEMWLRITHGHDWRGEFHNRKKNGELYWEFAVISPIKDEAGNLTHFLAVKEDITDRKRTDQERNRMEIQLRHVQKLESIGRLAAGIAHEINTPVQFIGDNTRFVSQMLVDLDKLIGKFAEILAAGKRQAITPALLAEGQTLWESADVDYFRAETPAALRQTLEGVERISKIVRAMKDFSHPGTEEKTLVDLNNLVESTLIVCRNEWKYVADLVTEFDPTLTSVPCLPGEFNQVILNLVVNAAQAIGEALGPGTTSKGTLTVTTKRIDGWAEIRIADSGTGIPEAVRPHLFEPFFTTKEVGRGTGQGLAIAHSVIADKHGGTIHFETEVGHGTTFIVRLPLAGGPNSPVRRAAAS